MAELRTLRSVASNRTSALTPVVIGVVIVTALYLGREVLVPIALALLLSFVLAPLVRQLERWRFPRILAVLIVGLFAFSTIFGLGAVMVAQVTQLAGDLPGYQSTLREKIRSVRGAAGGTGTLERASEVLQDLGKEIDRPAAEARVPPLKDGTPVNRPIPVEVKQPDPGALQMLAALIAPLVQPLTTTGIVVIFVIFILMQRQDLRNRLIRLAGAHDLQRTTAALDDAGQRLSRLFLSQLALNAGFGLVIGAGLWLIGVPSAPLWGMLAMIMRFVPYVGAVISAIFPLILAAAVGPDWSMLLMTAVLFLVAETLVAHAVEPLVSGHSTGLSPVAIIISATFWTWLWGPIGLILATPLTVCPVVLGRHTDRLKFLEVMFGDQPPLTPAELIYQRMLAGDPVEAVEQARAFLKEQPLAAYYDEILLEGLRLAQADAERGLLDEERMRRIRDAVAEIIDDLTSHTDRTGVDEAQAATQDGPLAQLEKAEAADAEEPAPAQGAGRKTGTVHSGTEPARRGRGRDGHPARGTSGDRRAGGRRRGAVDIGHLQLGDEGRRADLPVLRRACHAGEDPLRDTPHPAPHTRRRDHRRAVRQRRRVRSERGVRRSGSRAAVAARRGRKDQSPADSKAGGGLIERATGPPRWRWLSGSLS